MRHVFSILLVLSLAVSAPVAAQDVVTLDGPQLQLVERGLEAYDAGDWERAAAFFRAAIELGEVNLPIMNLGRTLQRAGKCFAAAETFDWAARAPAVAQPPRKVVLETLERYRSELVASCPGRLEMGCKYPDAAMVVDGRAAACGDFVEVPPGTYTVIGTRDRQQVRIEVRATPAKTTVATIDFPPDIVATGLPAPPNDPRASTKPGPDEASDGNNTAAWVFAGSSLALFATGGGLLWYSESLVTEATELEDPAQWEALRGDWKAARAGGWIAIGSGVVTAALAAFFATADGDDPATTTLSLTPDTIVFGTTW